LTNKRDRLALGYWPDLITGNTTPDLETHNWDLVKDSDPETGATSREDVFSACDCVTGPTWSYGLLKVP